MREMGYFASLAKVVVVVVLLCLLFPGPAFAYLDPGTGSYVLQVILAALVGAAFAVKLFWRNIRAFFKRLFSREEVDEEEAD
jgi:hypothetical protein